MKKKMSEKNRHVGLALFILCIVGLKPSFILGDTNASDGEFTLFLLCFSPKSLDLFMFLILYLCKFDR